MDLGAVALDAFPPVVLALTNLRVLSLAGTEVRRLPYVALAVNTVLTALDCRETPLLPFPPDNIKEQGGAAVMDHLRAWKKLSGYDTDLVLQAKSPPHPSARPRARPQPMARQSVRQAKPLPPARAASRVGRCQTVGEAEGGKTAVIAALADSANRAPGGISRTVSPEMSVWAPSVALCPHPLATSRRGSGPKSCLAFDNLLTGARAQDPLLLQFKVCDLGGAPLYDGTNAFFLSSAALVLLVFRIHPAGVYPDAEAVAAEAHAQTLHWLLRLSASAPGASVLLVATHIDAADPPDVDAQVPWPRPKPRRARRREPCRARSIPPLKAFFRRTLSNPPSTKCWLSVLSPRAACSVAAPDARPRAPDGVLRRRGEQQRRDARQAEPGAPTAGSPGRGPRDALLPATRRRHRPAPQAVGPPAGARHARPCPRSGTGLPRYFEGHSADRLCAPQARELRPGARGLRTPSFACVSCAQRHSLAGEHAPPHSPALRRHLQRAYGAGCAALYGA